MKLMLILAGTTLFLALSVQASQAQTPRPTQPLGPDGDAVLKLPGADVAPTYPPPTNPLPGYPAPQQRFSPPAGPPMNPGPMPYPSSGPLGPGQGGAVLNMWKDQPMSQQPSADPMAWPHMANSNALARLAPHKGPDPNQEFLVAPSQGPWMISLTSYTGEDAALMARQMVIELRGQYKLPAYVYNYGAEERQKEYDRVKDLVDKQRKFLVENKLPLNTPLRIRYMRIDEQCAVLLGNYANEQQARHALDALRKLPPLDPARVHLHSTLVGNYDQNRPNQVDQTERAYINPFQQAFLVRNPTVKFERPNNWDQLDAKSLKELNSKNPYSLLKCQKPFTLAVAQFQTPTVVHPKQASSGFLENLGLRKKTDGEIDSAAFNAHNLAEVLSKNCGLTAYVLHTKYSSVVTVGEFDSVESRELLDMQAWLGSRLRLGNIPLFPVPLPMQVPR